MTYSNNEQHYGKVDQEAGRTKVLKALIYRSGDIVELASINASFPIEQVFDNIQFNIE